MTEDVAIYIRPRTSWRKPSLEVVSISNQSEIDVYLRLTESLPFWVERATGNEEQPPPMAHFTEDGTVPDAAFEMIKHWLNHCVAQHQSCRIAGPSQLPSRVLDVGDEASNTDPRLVITDGRPGRYVTLSHRWGKAALPKTTKKTLEKHSKGICLPNLPKTYQDAVLVARRLGIQYLWIDSLCILQDDRSDWERESARMADVYRKSVCNLAADGAYDGSVGLFIDRNNLQVTGCRIRSSIKKGHWWYVLPLKSTDAHEYMTEGDLSGPLASRGWILQERLLSSRTVHFLPGEIFWECRETGARELKYILDRQKAKVAQDWGQVSTEDQGKPLARTFPGNFSNLGDLLYPAWYKLIEGYSSRKLTYPNDRLPAIWSMAEIFQETSNDRYVAGLWEKDLLAGLLFSRETDEGSSSGVNSTCPSWSWAALEGAVSYFDGMSPHSRTCESSKTTSHYDAEIVSLDVLEKGNNSMGRTQKAALTLRTYAIEGICKCQSQPTPRSNRPVHPLGHPSPSYAGNPYARDTRRMHPSSESIGNWSDGLLGRNSGKDPEQLPDFDNYWFGGFDNQVNPYGNTKWWREVRFPLDQVVGAGECEIIFDTRRDADKYAGNREKPIMLIYLSGAGLAVEPIDESKSEYRRVGVMRKMWALSLVRNWSRRDITLV
ncbi:hypothetical protein FQN54_005449 [Arachnomyces sp. PD_36]|nr:hypothetical protein FQN54_005449 [Arachnomyces sp. PD_36]